MARTKVPEEEKEGAVGAKRVRKLELVAFGSATKANKAHKTETKRSPKAEAETEEAETEEAEAVEAEEAEASKPDEEPEAAEAEEKAAEPAAEEKVEEEDENKIKRRHKPGKAAAVRVRREGKKVVPRFALLPYARAVRNIAHQISPQVMFQASALTHLRAISEGVALRVFQEAGILMRTSDKKRLTDNHVRVAAALRFQQAPGHTSAAYTQLHRDGYDHFDLARAMAFDYYETKPKREPSAAAKKKPRVKKPKAEEPEVEAAAADDA